MNTGWIKLHRKFIDWEWFDKSEMVHIFLFLLLSANHKDGNWHGINIKRGQALTGLIKINSSTGITIQKIRTCLKHLESTNEIIVKSTNKYSMITICNYDSYQDEKQEDNKQLTIKQQTINKQLTITKKKKKNKELIYKINEYKSEIINFTFLLYKFFDIKIIKDLTIKNELSWIDTIDKLIRIDKYTQSQIFEIVKNTRADEFWQKNFLTLTKLRKKDKEGITYIYKYSQIKPKNGQINETDIKKLAIAFDKCDFTG